MLDFTVQHQINSHFDYRHSDINPHFLKTADYLEFVFRFWKILNVKTPFKGLHKLDDFCKPVTAVDDPKFEFLRDFHSFLCTWDKDTTCRPISPQTMKAAKHTALSLIAIAQYCLKDLGFRYVLLGKFQLDTLEKRFGCYRQMNGGNFYVSVRQIQGSS